MPFISTVLGCEASEELSRVGYWIEHMCGAVRFSAAMEVMEQAIKPDVYLEIGAAPTLLGMARRFVPRKSVQWVASMDQKVKDAESLSKAAGAIGIGAGRPTVDFKRQPFPWRSATHPLLRSRKTRDDGSVVFSSPFDGHVLELLSHHIVHGEVVVPGACYLEQIIAGCGEYVSQGEAWCIESLSFDRPLVLRLLDGKLEEPTTLSLVIRPDGGIEVNSEMGSDPEDSIISTHVEATLVRQPGGWPAARPEKDSFNLEELKNNCAESVDIDLMYSFGRGSGLPLQKRFRTVRHVQKGDKQSVAWLEMERDGTEQGFLLGPSVIDGSFQASMALADADVGIGTLKIPLSIRRLQPTGRQLAIGVWK